MVGITVGCLLQAVSVSGSFDDSVVSIYKDIHKGRKRD